MADSIPLPRAMVSPTRCLSESVGYRIAISVKYQQGTANGTFQPLIVGYVGQVLVIESH